MKKILAAFFVCILMAVGAMALPMGGDIQDAPEFRYTDLKVNEDGTVSYTLHNDSDSNAVFHGRLDLVNTRSDEHIETEIVNVSVMAKSSVTVSTKLLHEALPGNAVESDKVAWSGVKIEK